MELLKNKEDSKYAIIENVEEHVEVLTTDTTKKTRSVNMEQLPLEEDIKKANGKTNVQAV